MGRKNKRRKQKPPLPTWTREPELKHKKGIAPHRSRCAFCGRLLDDGDFYWFPDEFGQFVRKCKNERDCSAHRKDEAEKAFRRAFKGRHQTE